MVEEVGLITLIGLIILLELILIKRRVIDLFAKYVGRMDTTLD
jgi:hypothetical protein